MFANLPSLMSPDDESGGGGAVDRGDFLPETKLPDPEPVEEPVKDEAEPEEPAAEPEKEEQPRDAQGKFAKKDKEHDDGPMVPKSRFDEQVTKERAAREAAERRLAELEATQKAASSAANVQALAEEVKALRAQERKALFEGNEEKAAEISERIDLLNRNINIANAENTSAQVKEQLREEIRVEQAVEKLELTYSALRQNSEDFNPKLVNFVLAEQRRLIEEERYSPSKALLKAAEDVMSIIEGTKKEVPTGLAAAKETTDRKAAQVAKNVAASKAQPGSLKEVGLDSDKAGTTKAIDVERLTTAEFDALPETTKAKLRGDFV